MWKRVPVVYWLTLSVSAVVFLLWLLPIFAIAQSIPTTLGWYEIPNSQLRSVCPNPSAYQQIQGNEGCSAIVEDWAGGALDTTRNRLIIMGGGHGGYAGNELYALDLNTLTMERLNEPSTVIRDGCTNGGTYADGKPVSRHTYNHLEYLPNQDAIFMWGGSQWQCGYFIGDTWFFNLPTLTWTKKSSANGPTANFGRAVAYDSNSNLIYARDDFDLYSYNPASNAWTKRSSSSAGMSDYKTGIIDPIRKKYYLHTNSSGATLYWYDISSPTASVTLQSGQTSGCSGFIGDYRAGWAFDSTQNRIVGWNGGNTIYILNPDTLSCTTVSYSGGPATVPNGTFGRFRYVPSLNLFVVCNSVDANCYTLRLTSGSTSPSTVQTPTVSLTASLASVTSGSSANLTWSSSNASSCSASGGWSGAKPTAGSQSTGSLTATTVFTLACTGSGGSASQSVTVTVTSPSVSETITIDFGVDRGPATYRGSGFLFGMSGTNPVASLVEPVKPRLFRFGAQWDSASYIRAKNLGANVQLILSDRYGYGSIPDATKWENLVANYANQAKSNNWILQWDIWNEPNHPYFWVGTQAQFFETWRLAVLKLRSIDPGAVIVGPSVSGFDQYYMQSFLTYAKANNVLPDILSWHDFNSPSTFSEHVQTMRSWMASNGINISRISLNEIVYNGEYAIPGLTVKYLAAVERSGVESAAHACWDEAGGSNCWNYSLDGILTFDGLQSRSSWWAYKGYADVTGRLVDVAASSNIDAVAGQDATRKSAATILGRSGGSGDVAVRYTRISSAAYLNNAGVVRVVAHRIPYSESAALSSPVSVINGDYPIANDALTVILPSFGPSDAYMIQLSPGLTAPAAAAPIVSIAANPIAISPGSSSTLTWNSTNATSCAASGGWSGTKAISGSQSTGNLMATTAFTLTCTGSGGSTSESVTVTASTTTPALAGSPTLLVKFGKTSALNSFGLSGWSTVIKDVYTDYQDIGPGGTTIVVGDNYAYNYQGVTGTVRNFVSGEKIRATWYNNSSSSVTFTPNISFTDPDRIIMGTTGAWYPMSSVTVPSFGSAISEYTFTSATAGSYSLVNVNVNYTNTQIIVADKIELLATGSSTSSFDFSLSNGGNKSVTQGQSVSNNIAATLLSGTVQAVTFSTSGLPSGAVATPSVTSCTPTCSTNISIATSTSTSAGSYPITVTATGGGSTKTTNFTLTVASNTPLPSTNTTVGSYPMPTVQDEKNTYVSWGWTWTANKEPGAVTEPITNYTVVNPDIHGDTEGDDLWTYLMMYRRTGNTVYLNRATAWARYFKNDYRNCVGLPGENFCYDRDAFGLDHFYGWGLIALYEQNGDATALTEAENLGAVLETMYGPNSPFGCLPRGACIWYGPRAGARHLLFMTRLAQVTAKTRWITLRDQIINLWLTSAQWDPTYGTYFVGDYVTDEVGGTGAFASGLRVQSAFQIGILSEAFDYAYRATGNPELKNRMIAMARFVDRYGLDPTYQYTASWFGVKNGQVWHKYSATSPVTFWDPSYTTALVNTLVRGYKYSGDIALYNRAKYFFNRGTKGIYGSPTQRAAADNVVAHFVDTVFSTGDANRYLDYNKGELQYTWLIFENGGFPIVDTGGTSTVMPAAPSGLTLK